MFIECKQKDWGKGIPEYTSKDLMSEDDLYDFALDVVAQYEVERNGYEPVSANPDKDSLPSLVVKINGKLTFILVEASVAPIDAKLNSLRKANLLKRAAEFGADAYYAPVGFGAVDGERFNKSLALKGDAFYPKYCGMEKVPPLCTDDKTSSEYKLYVLGLIGRAYKECNYDLFKDYVDENCHWHSPYSGWNCTNKEEISNYYIPKFKTIAKSGTNDMDYQLVCFSGNKSRAFKGNAEFQDVIHEDAYLRLRQEDGKPSVAIYQGSNGMLLDVSFNGSGKIVNMEIREISICNFVNR